MPASATLVVMSTECGSGRRPERGAVGSPAFTLVELLVVIAIIALLLGILVPTLASAREAARNVICQNNLRTLGIAFQGYRDDHDGRFPVAEMRVSVRSGDLDPLTDLAAQLEIDVPRMDSSGEHVVATQPWVCPSDREAVRDEKHPVMSSFVAPADPLVQELPKWEATGWSYWYRPVDLMALRQFQDAGREFARRWDYLTQYRRTELIADVGWNHGVGIPWKEALTLGRNDANNPKYRNRGRNVLWVDGRVDANGDEPPGPP